MKAKLVVQVLLRSENKAAPGYSTRVCWIDNARIKVGSQVTLTNSEDRRRRWEVVAIFTEDFLTNLHQDWKVGGL